MLKLTTSLLSSNLLPHLHTFSNLLILILKATPLQVYQSELVDHFYIRVHSNQHISWGSKAETEWHYVITSLKASTLYHLSLQVTLEGPSLPVRPFSMAACSTTGLWLLCNAGSPTSRGIHKQGGYSTDGGKI